jgi:hypothetical protein
MLYYILFTVLILQVLATNPFNQAIDFIPAAIQAGPSEGQFVSSARGFDASKIHPVNGSAYDW